MMKTILALLLLILLAACVPLSQQVSLPPDNAQQIIINDTLYNELKYVVDNGIYELKHNEEQPWKGPCNENPQFESRFQSGYSTKALPINISGHVLTFKISYGGGCGCQQIKMVWNGKLITEPDGTKVVELVFSFKSLDICRAMVHDTLVYDLRSLNLAGNERVYIRINKFPTQVYLPE